MSSTFRTNVFLPTSILKFVVKDDDDSQKIDCKRFLSQAYTSQVLEIICLLYPYVKFSDEARDDHVLLKKIFLEIVAPQLSTLIIPTALKPDQDYFQASINIPAFGTYEFEMLITPGIEINAHRISEFNYLILCYLRNGQHRIAAHNLTGFVKTYKYLNKIELSTLDSAYQDTLEGLHEAVGFVQSSHHDIEGIGFLLSESELSPSHRQGLQLCLERGKEKLKSCQEIFERIVADVGFVQALVDYYQKLPLTSRIDDMETLSASSKPIFKFNGMREGLMKSVDKMMSRGFNKKQLVKLQQNVKKQSDNKPNTPTRPGNLSRPRICLLEEMSKKDCDTIRQALHCHCPQLWIPIKVATSQPMLLSLYKAFILYEEEPNLRRGVHYDIFPINALNLDGYIDV
ncbi:uncharacterized protein MELLADRAFT_88393 [Melampsora larici-populina 98AG31]|uniref:Uncharacterized protein n=1 Tax=Melampsora larici-populina (strain 98AG31 / pathotype 3-4-7) TaxID=747676 RepID=F4RRK1_MELLP|nr:uncharacterized protein MELLADRAFT_88393 [Melampsora larici-populina 98AG31]EGG04945.1 hypothetical protein MELLADRAFT_88393 [Melampsora larici-populina 98AG31]